MLYLYIPYLVDMTIKGTSDQVDTSSIKGKLKGVLDFESTTKTTTVILNIAFSFVGMLGIIFLIYGGYMYITARGDDTQMENAKKLIIGVIIGILVILFSYTILNTILAI